MVAICNTDLESCFMGESKLITIITSTFNAADELPITINSIRQQGFTDFEWIIVDGGSSDETLKIINENLDIISHYISEPDDGIYDAWNKAVRISTGTWIQFLGAGDELYDGSTLSNVSKYLKGAYPTHDIVYGRIQLLTQDSRICVDEIGEPWNILKNKWQGILPKLPIHPEIYHHSSILKKTLNPFDVKFKIAGDTHFLLRHIFDKPPLYIPVIVDRMPLGGISSQIKSALPVFLETKIIHDELDIRTPKIIYFKELLKAYIKNALCVVLPHAGINRIADLYRSFRRKNKRWTVG